MLTGKQIVCFSTEDWDPPLPTNKHQLMLRLAKNGNRVLYIETLGIRKPGLGKSDMTRICNRLKKVLSAPQERFKNLLVLSPLVVPGRGSGISLAINKALFRRRLKKAIRHAGFDKPIVWVFNPYAVHFLDAIPHELLIYHCVDDLSHVPGADSQSILEAERELLRRAHLVLTTSPPLYEKCRAFNTQTVFQPNVGDFSHFNKAMQDTTSIAEPVANLKHPVIMFAGNIAAAKVDFELIQQLTMMRIDWSVVLIGPVWNDVSPLQLDSIRKYDNLHLLPQVPYPQLPSYLKAADVLIIPYHMNDYTRCVFPLKFFEFLATGKPVVSMALPSLKQYEGIVSVTETYQGFMRAVDEAVKMPDIKQAQRLELARENTWESRLKEISDLIEEKLSIV